MKWENFTLNRIKRSQMILCSSGHVLPPNEVRFVWQPNELFLNPNSQRILDLGMVGEELWTVFIFGEDWRCPEVFCVVLSFSTATPCQWRIWNRKLCSHLTFQWGRHSVLISSWCLDHVFLLSRKKGGFSFLPSAPHPIFRVCMFALFYFWELSLNLVPTTEKRIPICHTCFLYLWHHD